MINNQEDLTAWLQKQTAGVSVAFAARAALRVLPIVKAETSAVSSLIPGAILVPVFRATAVSWATAQYPAHAIEFSNAALAAGAFSTDRHVNTAALAAFAAAYAADAPRAALTAALTAAFAALKLVEDDTLNRTFWTAVSIDALHVEEGETASVLAGAPLWRHGQPARLRSSWQQMKAALLAAGQDWRVWAFWYADRLAGRVQDEECELAYVRIEEDLWDQGPAIVNAEIKRRMEAHAALSDQATNAADSSEIGAAMPGIAGSRRPVFHGFFSYTHSDAEVDPHIVEAFSSELEKRVDAKLVNARFEIWRDKEKLRVGDYWDQSIKGAIDSSHIFIVLLTPKWISSDYCRKEFEAFEQIEATRKSGGYVIPMYARDIESQARFLEAEQRELLARLKRIQYQQVIPKQFARLSEYERIELIENVADPICDMLDRLRDKPET